MAFVRLDDIVVHYERAGAAAGTTIVFAGSLGTDLRVWDALVPELAGRFPLLRYDQRGHGLTDATAPPYTIDRLADDLARLLSHLGIDGAIVCGLSIGGMTAQRLAAARPELVRALVLMDTAHRIGTREMWQQRIDAVARGGIGGIADAVLERWFTRELRERRTEELAGWRNMLTRTPVDGYVGCCAAIRDADLTESTAALRLPTLCLVGEEDGATPPGLVSELAALVPDASLVSVPGAGHLPCVEQPALVLAAIEDFLERTDVG